MSVSSRHWKVPSLTLLSFAFIAFPSKILSLKDSSNLGDLDLYKITWMGPMSDEAEKLMSSYRYNDDNLINIATKNQERYRCVVPDEINQLNFDTSATNSSSEEKNKNPFEVLDRILSNKVCSQKYELFWTYELCHGMFLRQYHEESSKFKSKITQEYYLGRIEPEELKGHIEEYEKEKLELERTGRSRPTVLVNGHHKPYVMINMTGGTKCDLTKKSRVARVIYVCDEVLKHELYSIKETSTCEYEAIVLSPLLCLHRDFKVDVNTQREIQCYALGDAPKRPPNSIDTDEEEKKNANKERGIAYFQGRTLIIDADLILS